MSYKKRNCIHKINDLLTIFPVVTILGPRQCGKTTLSKKLRESWKYFDLQNPNDFDRIISDPLLFFEQNPEGVIIDEAQLSPELFSVLRGVIDDDRQKKGRFILTGSSSYELKKNISESLAGRAATVELATFKCNETFEKELPKIYKLIESIDAFTVENIKKLSTDLNKKQFMASFLWGGWPEVNIKHDQRTFEIWMNEYYKSYLNRDILALFPKLNLIRYRRFVQMLAQLTGQIINKAELARSIDVSEKTIRDYFSIADGTFIWRMYYSYDRSSVKSITKMPKGGLRDSGLLNFLLKISSEEDLYNHPLVGRLFENFVSEEIIKGISATMATNWDYWYYRTKNNAEIDLIIDINGRIIPIEIKYGKVIDSRKLKTLSDFIIRNNLPFGVLVNNGDDIHLVTRNIIQIPIQYW